MAGIEICSTIKTFRLPTKSISGKFYPNRINLVAPLSLGNAILLTQFARDSTISKARHGKAASRFNALKTGIHAQSQVIPGEDPAELEALAAGYHQQFPAATPLECFLVDALIHADWQLRRLHRLEAQLWADQIHDTEGEAQLGKVYARALDVFTRLQRRIDATERSYYRALTQLQRLQAAVTPAILSPVSPQPIDESPASLELASFGDIPAHPSPPAAGAPLLPHHMR